MENKYKKEQRSIKDFGLEWNYFKNQDLEKANIDKMFENYFSIFPFDKINSNSVGVDFGAGSGRFSIFFVKKVKHMHLIEPSIAINNAKDFLTDYNNVTFHQRTIKDLDLKNNSIDFGYCLGVLHHTVDINENLKICVNKLKKEKPFLLYLYYSLDNQPIWYKFVWKITDIIRLFICKLPFKLKLCITFLIALFIYYPLAKTSKIFEKIINLKSWPLSAYRNHTLYVMRNDALDRFGTRIEKRYSKKQITEMMKNAGLQNISFSPKEPFWCAIGYKKN